MLAYLQLYLAKEIVHCMPQPWERYLPEYKNFKNTEQAITTPSQAQRGFSDLLKVIDTPASTCVTRGKPRGRMAGETQMKREDQPIVFKTKKAIVKTEESIFLGLASTGSSTNPQKIDELINLVQSSLEKHNLTPSEFTKMLINSS